VIVKIGKNEKEIEAPKEVVRAIEDFCELKAKIDAESLELSSYKDTIVDFAKNVLDDSKNSTVTLSVGNDSVKVAFGWDIKISDIAKLQEILGDKFDLLVKERIEYKPEAKLKEMALVDDGIKECLIIKEKAASVSVI
jgi:hypothetical protein